MVDLLEARRRILLNTPHLESLSGATASFETDISAKLKECKVYFTPIQEGSGDPSPDNVRPIVGWDGVTVYTDGKYYADTDKIFDEGVLTGTVEKIIIYDFSIKNGTYTVYTDVPNNSSQSIASVFAANGKLRTPTSGGNGVFVNAPRTVTVTNGLLSLGIRTGSGTYLTWNKQTFAPYYILIERDKSEIDASHKITIPFPQTIYGGYVDLVNGEVVEELSIIDLGTVSLSQYSKSNHCWFGAIADMKFGNAIELSELYCDSYKPLSKKSILSDGEDLSIWPYNTGQRRLIIRNDSYIQEDRTYAITSFKESLQGVMACIPLATPTTYPLDPVTIRTLRGINNIWSDANGNIEIKYWTH